MVVDVLEGLLEEDDEVVQVSNEVMTQLVLSCKTVVVSFQSCFYFVFFHI